MATSLMTTHDETAPVNREQIESILDLIARKKEEGWRLVLREATIEGYGTSTTLVFIDPDSDDEGEEVSFFHALLRMNGVNIPPHIPFVAPVHAHFLNLNLRTCWRLMDTARIRREESDEVRDLRNEILDVA